MPANRTRVLQESVVETSPEDPELQFTIRRMGNRERIRRQDLFARLRFIQVDEGGTVTERELPMGQIALEDIMMGLTHWTVADNGPVAITKENVQDYLSAAEFDFLLDKIRDLNPIVFGVRDGDKKPEKPDGGESAGTVGEEPGA